MTVTQLLANLNLATGLVALAAFSAFGALFCRLRQLTLSEHKTLAWLFYVALACSTGLIGLQAVFFGRADMADATALVGVWAMLLHTYAAWADGPHASMRRVA